MQKEIYLIVNSALAGRHQSLFRGSGFAIVINTIKDSPDHYAIGLIPDGARSHEEYEAYTVTKHSANDYRVKTADADGDEQASVEEEVENLLAILRTARV